MEETTCSSCGRQMSLKDLDRRSFREINGELYCPECFLKMGRPKRMRCPDCGEKTTALLHDGKYTCTHCGREIGGQQENGVIASAKPPVDRDQPADVVQPDTRPQKPPATVRRKTKKSRVVPVLAVALSCFFAASLVLGALLIRGLAPDGEPVAQPTQTEDEEILRLAEKWHSDYPDDYDGAIKLYKDAVDNIQDRVLKMKARGVQLALEEKLDAAEKADEKAKEELPRKLAAARQQIQQLNEELKKATSELKKAAAELKKATTAAAVRPAPPVPAPQPPAAPQPAKVVGKTNDSAHAAYLAAMKKAEGLIQTRHYGSAMEAVRAVAAKYPHTEWAEKAETERQRILDDAYQEYRALGDRAEILVKTGDHDGARELYAKASLFGVPEIDDIVRQKLAAMQQTEKATATGPVAIEPPAIVKKHIGALKNGDDNERSKAALKLGALGNQAAVPHLVDALKDKYWLVRARAAVGLGKLGDVKAVPALVEALSDKEKSVVFDVHGALKAITKQTFSHEEKEQWLAWYRTRGANPPSQPAPLKAGSFQSSVLMRKYGPDVVRFAAPKSANLKAGMKVNVFRGTDFICRVIIWQVNEKGEVSGGIEGLKPGAKLAPGDVIVVQLPK